MLAGIPIIGRGAMSYQGGGYQSGYQSASRPQGGNYENIGGAYNNGSSQQQPPRMQHMEVLSGKEYGNEFESHNHNQSFVRNRWAIYIGVAFLLVVALLAPHKDDENSNFKLPKNQKNNATTSTSVSTPSYLDDDDDDDFSPTPGSSPPKDTSPPTTHEKDVPQSAVPAATGRGNNNSTPALYATNCSFPETFRKDASNFTYLNVSDFCPPIHEQRIPGECHCLNPVKPARPAYSPQEWSAAMTKNIVLVNQSLESQDSLDIVFLGDSITEHWNGLSFGEPRPNLYNVTVVFQRLFQKKNGSSLEGLALGISGDRCQNLLYRLQHGELPETLKPRVFWLLIGTNDLGADSCSVDSITAGNIRIIEEIRHKHPTIPIVINSLLPRDTPELLRHNFYWKTLSTVNHRLECYAKTQPHVEFFNATDIFIYKQDFETTDDDEEVEVDYYINQTLMRDHLHPSGEGAMLWGQAIVKKVQSLMEGKQ